MNFSDGPLGTFRIAYTYGNALRENRFNGLTWDGDHLLQGDANGRSGSAIIGLQSTDPQRTYYIAKNGSTDWNIKDQTGVVVVGPAPISYNAQITAIKRVVGADQLFWGDATGHLWTASAGSSFAVDITGSDPENRMGF